MNNLDLEQKKNRILYRELFHKANEGFKEQITNLKVKSYCKKERVCCKVRYTGFTPAEILSLKQENDDTSSEYTRLFIPYGANSDFDYENNNQVDIELNHQQASRVNKDYVNSVLAKLPGPVYFYLCKHLNNNECTLKDEKSFLCDGYPSSVTRMRIQGLAGRSC